MKPICDQAVLKRNSCTDSDLDSPCQQDSNRLLDKCDQANNILHTCLGLDKEPWTLQSSKPGHLTCGEWKKLMIAGTAQNCVAPVSEIFEKKLWCLSSIAEISQVRSHPVDYILDFDPNSCITTEDDVRQFKASLPLPPGSSSEVSRNMTNNSTGQKNPNPFNIFSFNPIETWRNIQGFLDIPKGLNSLVQTAEILSGPELLPKIPEPAISTDSEGKLWNFLPGYIPPKEGKISIVSGQGQIKPPGSYQFIPVINTSNSSEMVTYTFLGSTFKNSANDVAQFRYVWDTNSGAVINVFPQAEVQFAKPVSGEAVKEAKRMIMLNKGELEVKIKNDNAKNKFGVQTDYLDLIVIGTHFWVSHDPNSKQTVVGVYEGKVEVKTKDGQTAAVTPDGDKPGVIVVSQKLSLTKLAFSGVVLAAAIGGTLLFLKKKKSKPRKH